MAFVTLRFSAHKLHLGTACCSCCRANATGSYTTQYSRVTGIRVERTATRWWKFPLCQSCLDWVHGNDVADLAEADMRWAETWSLGLLIGGLVAACWCGLSGCVALANAERTSTVCVAVVLPLSGLAAAGYGSHLRATLPELRQRARQKRSLADNLEPQGAAGLPPVEMSDWYGSVWAFTFANKQYAQWLATANSSKLGRVDG